jgi:competence protein ComEC
VYGCAALERWLEAERDQLVLWLPVALGAGAAAWLLLPDARAWSAALLGALALAAGALAMARGGRAPAIVATAALAFALGVALIWWRAERVAAPVLARATIAVVEGQVERVEPLPARGLTRVTLTGLRWAEPPRPAPLRIRVNLPVADVPSPPTAGAIVRLRARLMPPPPAAVPGAYDFARTAWFDGLGATGRSLGAIRVLAPGAADGGVRQRLTTLIQRRLPGSAGGIAAALATGDTGAIDEADAEAMRRAGLAHLLSVSGLHITAAVGIVMALAMRLLALSPRLALTGRVPLIAAGAGALAAIGYTWLTGAQVPTIRSCVAALMVLVALALGREAITLRLVAAGATIVLLAWPEAVAGPSFQLSFAAVTAIVALHEHPRVRGWFLARDEGVARRGLRHLASLLLTGVVVEWALMPIAVFHFHKAGVYGAIANIVAIPLTTFVIMPLEALALLVEPVGLGAPFWWVTGQGMAVLLWIARTVAALPGAVAALPAMPGGAFAAMVGGGLWVALWRTRWRRLGAVPLALGAAWALATPAPDLIVTGDGRHLAMREAGGGVAILRDRSGDYVRDMLAESGGVDGEPMLLSDSPDARCNRDLCWIEARAGGRRWRVLATRSAYLVPAGAMIDWCARADVVVSERRLSRRCRARWLTLDRAALARSGGVAVTFATGRVATVRRAGDRHPWVAPVDAPDTRRGRRSGRVGGDVPREVAAERDRPSGPGPNVVGR